MSLKWIGLRIGVLDKDLLSPCTLRNKGSESGVELIGNSHSELVKDFHLAATEKVAKGADLPIAHNLPYACLMPCKFLSMRSHTDSAQVIQR